MTVFGALVLAVVLVVFWRAVLIMVAVSVVALLILGVSSVLDTGRTHGPGSAPAPSLSRSVSPPHR